MTARTSKLRAVVFYGYVNFIFSNVKRRYISRFQKKFKNNKFNSHKITSFLSEVLTAYEVDPCCLKSIIAYLSKNVKQKNICLMFFYQLFNFFKNGNISASKFNPNRLSGTSFAERRMTAATKSEAR